VTASLGYRAEWVPPGDVQAMGAHNLGSAVADIGARASGSPGETEVEKKLANRSGVSLKQSVVVPRTKQTLVPFNVGRSHACPVVFTLALCVG